MSEAPLERLDDPRAIERVDRHHTAQVLAAFPKQCREAAGLRLEPGRRLPRPRLALMVAMGGSAAAGDLLAGCAAERSGLPVLVHRGYGLPAFVAGEDLVVVTSYSGETAEALSAAEAAVSRRVPLVAVSAGGALGRLAAAHDCPRVALPPGLMPRMALGYLFFAGAAALRAAGVDVATDGEIAEALDVIELLGPELTPDRPAAANEAKRLALAIGDLIPAVYGGPTTAEAAYRWKTELEENAKVLALAGVLPEMNHNEIEAWQGPVARRVHPVLLRDGAEAPEVVRRFALLRDMLETAVGGPSEVWARGRGRPARALSLAHLGQWTSFYVAMLRGTDPWPVPRMDDFKRRLGGG